MDDDTVLPGGSSILRVSGAPGSTVGFVAVDKAVYLLNNKGLLTKNLVQNGSFTKSNDRSNFYGFLYNN